MMIVPIEEPSQENTADRYPLLTEPHVNNENMDYVIDLERGCDGSSPSSSRDDSPCGTRDGDVASTSTHLPIPQSHPPSIISSNSNSRNSSSNIRGEGSSRRHWSPFNTILWLSIELVFTVGQIMAAIVVLSVSRHENPKTPLFAWIVGYTVGCTAMLPILYWRYLQRYRGNENGSTQSQEESPQSNSATADPNSYVTLSLARPPEGGGDSRNSSPSSWNVEVLGSQNARLSAFMDHLKMALDCFFAVWFVVGNVWIFGGHSSSSVAPNLYRLCIVFLTFCCIGYAMPFILCSMICCCLPCIISILGVRDDMNRMKGASEETINALPTHQFKSNEREGLIDTDCVDDDVGEGGFLAVGTEKERAISGEDAVCCICLARYADNDELRELPCTHFFHTQCVDKWLKINASCPLCKFEIGTNDANTPTREDSSQQEGTNPT